MIELQVENIVETRLDRFLRQKFAYLTQGVIEKNLRKGQIKVNGKKAKADKRVSKGDVVNIANYLINENLTIREKTFFFSCRHFIS